MSTEYYILKAAKWLFIIITVAVFARELYVVYVEAGIVGVVIFLALIAIGIGLAYAYYKLDETVEQHEEQR